MILNQFLLLICKLFLHLTDFYFIIILLVLNILIIVVPCLLYLLHRLLILLLNLTDILSHLFNFPFLANNLLFKLLILSSSTLKELFLIPVTILQHFLLLLTFSL
mmetsp:Transcript_36377/g.6505  ORF Transcript_36377/g.6505 Transcript_36377/m.6505 type:complete len:105 (-) Transcript_36377:548-862(-)